MPRIVPSFIAIVLPLLPAVVRPAVGQSWQVDAALVATDLRAEAYADTCSNNNPMPPGNCVERPGPADLEGTCPPFAWLPDGWASYPQWMIDRPPAVTQIQANPFFDLFAGIDAFAVDLGPFANQAGCTAQGFVLIDGIGSRTLEVGFSAQTIVDVNDDDGFGRGCVAVSAGIPIEAVGLPDTPVIIRYDFEVAGNAQVNHECEDPIWAPLCAQMGLPAQEDPATASLDVNLAIGGPDPGVLVDVGLDNLLPGSTVQWVDDATDALTFSGGAATIGVGLTLDGHASLTAQQPIGESSEADFVSTTKLYLVSHDFLTDEPFDDYMRLVPGGGAGPSYDFRIGRYEITNQQYADFLNSAELDGGATDLGSNLLFGADGDVALPDGTYVFSPVAPGSRIVYTPGAPLGTRYTVAVPAGSDPRSYERHPVVNVSWLGAVKFCNWLTLKRCLPASERSYTEGPNAEDWHPATIGTADWVVRDLNDVERQALVASFRGFRLPMDGLFGQLGHVSNQVDSFNEWYKAAAYDPAAPATVRGGPGGESVPPGHWIYAFGRDSIGFADANYSASGDPFDDDDAFVGLYDGSLYNPGGNGDVGSGSTFQSQASANLYGIFDLSGNVREMIQDRPSATATAIRGGSWSDGSASLAASYRDAAFLGSADAATGFRIVQSWCPADLNGDGAVDVSDLLFALASWGPCTCCPADVNRDGVVDVSDMLLILASWGSC